MELMEQGLICDAVIAKPDTEHGSHCGECAKIRRAS